MIKVNTFRHMIYASFQVSTHLSRIKCRQNSFIYEATLLVGKGDFSKQFVVNTKIDRYAFKRKVLRSVAALLRAESVYTVYFLQQYKGCRSRCVPVY